MNCEQCESELGWKEIQASTIGAIRLHHPWNDVFVFNLNSQTRLLNSRSRNSNVATFFYISRLHHSSSSPLAYISLWNFNFSRLSLQIFHETNTKSESLKARASLFIKERSGVFLSNQRELSDIRIELNFFQVKSYHKILVCLALTRDFKIFIYFKLTELSTPVQKTSTTLIAGRINLKLWKGSQNYGI